MPNSNKTTLEVRLADADPESLGSLPVRLVASDFTLSICPQGYGDFTSENGEGCPLFVEFYRGRLRVIAFPNINCEEALIIDISSAREDCRGVAGAAIEATSSVPTGDPPEQFDCTTEHQNPKDGGVDTESADVVAAKLPLVECKFCHRQVRRDTAHQHQHGWVGDDCCWDERLRSSE